ncbi:hypothetical protein [Alicyclobacillus sp. SO9]|uniref:PGN_0703 family putative restriction endonuclease n=1 Tax=Alicyclobacillus sp. SO9 TaxID=2665646 RepID=UPI0018E7AAAA|nr:hypothetical protein [Alicyclobacillus sp. SO9]QQE80458.1 hypothetical protein GI364_08620 [Alicyclobacillus sp. SO9]
MYLWDDLKKQIKETDTTVQCPVEGCQTVVKRQRRSFRREEQFLCTDHKIYISPTTWEYKNFWDNLLEQNDNDRQLMQTIVENKAESRLARDKSEDAVTWNVFRHLQKKNLVGKALQTCLGTKNEKDYSLIYWSYSQENKSVWKPLVDVRKIFKENQNHPSEPDLIIEAPSTIVLIEAKFTSGNRTTPSNLAVESNYVDGGDNWFRQVFQDDVDFQSVAVQDRFYELMRMWLLGTWIAKEKGKKFVLVNLVLEDKEPHVEEQFGRNLIQNSNRRFKRCTWEQIYRNVQTDIAGNHLEKFFKGKTLGYPNRRDLKRAFKLDE